MLKQAGAALRAAARRHARTIVVAVSVAAVAFAACGRAALAPAPLAGEPVFRIGLVTGSAAVKVRGDGDVAAVAGGQPVFRLGPGDSVVLIHSGQGVEVRGRDGGHYQTVSFSSLTPGKHVVVDGRPYRGAIEVTARPAGLTAVNIVNLEFYLLGVVSAEMGRRGAAERAALAAQAVVSRTYALRNRGRSATSGYDLAANTTDQAYGGIGAETPDGNAAVRATSGITLMYQGRPIQAFFHSTCGYATATADEAFRGLADEPYLRSVSDKRPGGYYCDISPRFRWTVTWEAAALRDILRRTLPATVGIAAAQVDDVKDVRVRRTGPSGRAAEVRVQVGGGEIPVFGPDLRTVFAQPTGEPLGGTAFQLTAEREGDRLVRLTAVGAGWGHGVGMCQWGAVGRARAGQDFKTILAAYFPGAELQRLY